MLFSKEVVAAAEAEGKGGEKMSCIHLKFL
jgi:hypothetical protein